MPAATEPDSADSGQAGLWRTLAAGLIPTLGLVALSFVLPPIPLDTAFADWVVTVTDSSTWQQLPVLSVLAVLMITSRAGLSGRRRLSEAGAMLGTMIVALALMATFNEHVLKPAVASPRPNIVLLAEQHALGPSISTGDEFYALGDKDARRAYLEPQLEILETPALSDDVRAHWAHETGYSFPSGHATASMTFATMIFALGLAWLTGWRRRISSLMPIWAVCVVYSRPLLQVHRAVDVSVGSVIGVCLGLLSFVVIRRLTDRIAGPLPSASASAPPAAST